MPTLAWLTLATLGCTCAEVVADPPALGSGIAVTVAHIVAVAAVPWAPVPASICVATLYALTYVVPVPVDGPTQLWGVWLALGVLGAKGTGWLGVGTVAVVILARAVESAHWHPGTTPVAATMLALSCVAAWLVGSFLKASAEHNAAAMVRAELAERRRRDNAARTLHDHVAGSLTFIVMQARHSTLDEGGGAAARTDFERIERTASEALADVRATMSLLEGTPRDGSAREGDLVGDEIASGRPEPGAARPGEVGMSIGAAAEDLRSSLARLGFTGSVLVQGPVDRLSAQRADLVRHALAELGTNIAKHGCPDDTYVLRVKVEGDGAVGLTSVNALASRPAREPGAAVARDEYAVQSGCHPGRGLRLLHAAVESAGGSLHVATGDGEEWVVSVDLPADPVRQTSRRTT